MKNLALIEGRWHAWLVLLRFTVTVSAGIPEILNENFIWKSLRNRL